MVSGAVCKSVKSTLNTSKKMYIFVTGDLFFFWNNTLFVINLEDAAEDRWGDNSRLRLKQAQLADFVGRS